MSDTPRAATPERWQAVKQALVEALALDGEARDAYVTALKDRDAALYEEVEQLLTYSRAADVFLEHPAVPGDGPASGTAFGGYQVQTPLGTGGMGTVYLARELALDRLVALKFLTPALQRDGEARQRFLREARAAAALDHPYICKIFQTGEESGQPFIAMEYIRGETLQHRLVSQRVPLTVALQIAIEIAEALETAHGARIVHRDLKPSNVMLTAGGHVKVLDFGLAKRVGEGTEESLETAYETRKGTVQGTIAYMSPEQVRGEEVDSRSDIFSLGIVLYEMVAGSHPFKGEVPAETPSLILRHTPPPLSARRAEVPPLLEQIIGRMLAKTREDRYEDAHALRLDLTRLRDFVDRSDTSNPVHGDTASALVAPRLTTGRRTVVAGILAIGLLAAGSGLWWGLGRGGGSTEPLSVAVLPFSSSSAETEYLASGIAQAVITRLHKAGLRVIPWTTASRFASNSDPDEVAGMLGVGAVVTATVQSDGRGLLVTASLVEGGVLSWTEEFQELFDNTAALFSVQTRIAQRVAEGLGQELSPAADAALARAESDSADAYDFYLQGADFVQKGDQESIGIAESLFSHALDIDPNLVEARVGLGSVFYLQFWNGWGTLDDLARAGREFESALSLDANDMRALRGLQQIEFVRGNRDLVLQLGQRAALTGARDIETQMAVAQALTLAGLGAPAERALRRVLALDPVNEFARYHLALNAAYLPTGTSGPPDDYIEQFGDDPYVTTFAGFLHEKEGDAAAARDRYGRAARRLVEGPNENTGDWFALSSLLYAGTYYERAGEQERARSLWRKGAELTAAALFPGSDNFKAHILLGAFYAFLGDEAMFRSEERMAEAIRRAPGLLQPWDWMYLAAAHARLGDTARAREILGTQLLVGVQHLWPLLGPALWQSPAFVDVRRQIESRQREVAQQYPTLVSY